MMDLSDGLSKDCRTLAFENKLGIVLKFDSLQIPNAMIKLSTELNVPVVSGCYMVGRIMNFYLLHLGFEFLRNYRTGR